MRSNSRPRRSARSLRLPRSVSKLMTKSSTPAQVPAYRDSAQRESTGADLHPIDPGQNRDKSRTKPRRVVQELYRSCTGVAHE
jgi:hypothetical protein